MDIQTIAVENFRSHQKTEIKLGKVTALVGPNGSGKSSLIEAPATCLIGENTWTSRDGVTLSNLIRAGAKEASVSVGGKRTITRQITAKGSKLSLDDGETITQAMLLGKLKVTVSQLRTALIPNSFLALTSAHQKEAIFDLLAPKFTVAAVAEHVPASETWDKLAARWIKEHGEEEDVDLDKFYQFVYEARRNYKAKAKTQENPRQKELVAKISDVSKKIASVNFENEQIKIALRAREALPEKQKELAALLTRRKDVAALKKEWNELDDFQREAERKLAAAEAILKASKSEGLALGETKLKDGKIVCPIGLSCPHDEKALKDRGTFAKGLKIAEDAKILSAKQKLKDADRLLAEKRAELETAETVNHQIEALQEDIKKFGEAKPRKLIDRSALEEERKAVEAELATLPSVGGADEAVVDKLDAIVGALNVHGIKTKAIEKAADALEKEVNGALSRFGAWTMRFFVEGEFSPTILREGGGCLLGELSDGERAVLSLVIQDVFSRRSGVNLVVVDNIDLLDGKACGKFFEVACKITSKVLVGTTNGTFIPKMDAVKTVNLSPGKPGKSAPSPADPPMEDLL